MFGISSSKQSEEYYCHDLFTSIRDLPQWNWNKIHATDNFIYLKKLPFYKKGDIDSSDYLKECFNNIYNEFIEEFGWSEDFSELLAKKKEIAELKNEFIIDGDRTLLTFITMAEKDLEYIIKKSTKRMTFQSLVVHLEKKQGFPIDEQGITVYKFNNYLRTLNDTNGDN